MTWARMPWRVAFREERCLPSGVRGPVDFLAFSRLARRRASETGRLGLSAGSCSVFPFALLASVAFAFSAVVFVGVFVCGFEQVFGVVVLGHRVLSFVCKLGRCTGISWASWF